MKEFSIVATTLGLIATLFTFLEYLISWREELETVIGTWGLGLFEGVILTTIVSVSLYGIFHHRLED